MARKRKDTAYESANRRARERGFHNVYDERKYRERHREEIESAKEFVRRPTTRAGRTYNPEEARAYARAFMAEERYLTKSGELRKRGKGRAPDSLQGSMRHFAIAYFVDYEGMDQEEAIAAMRDVYGDSGEAPV